MTCPDCDGTGICDYVDDGGPDTCDTCNGKGTHTPVLPPLSRQRLIALEKQLAVRPASLRKVA